MKLRCQSATLQKEALSQMFLHVFRGFENLRAQFLSGNVSGK